MTLTYLCADAPVEPADIRRMSNHGEDAVRDQNVSVLAEEPDVVVEVAAGRPHCQLA